MDAPRTKTVGRRRMPEPASSEEAFDWQDSASEMLAEVGLPRGRVVRFRSFEEADRWLMEETIRAARALRRKRISRESRRA